MRMLAQMAPGWVHDDPPILESDGAASSEWASLVARIPEVAERITRPGARLLDVGTAWRGRTSPTLASPADRAAPARH